jgi:hypothetical protein
MAGWSTILLALSDSQVKVNCVLGVVAVLDPELAAAAAADCTKLILPSRPPPLPFGVSGPCSAAVLIAWEMMPPVAEASRPESIGCAKKMVSRSNTKDLLRQVECSGEGTNLILLCRHRSGQTRARRDTH